MARKTNKRDLAPVLDAAKQWIDRCLIGDQSIFFDEPLWTLNNAESLYAHFADAAAYSGKNVFEKLRVQTAVAPIATKQLIAEIFWAVRLFPTNPKAFKKSAQFFEVWALCDRSLQQDHPKLNDDVLGGIGSAGPAYLTQPWREVRYVALLLLKLKGLSQEERESLFQSNVRLSPWLDAVVDKGKRQFPHILRYFTFPNEIERIASRRDKAKILQGYGERYENFFTALQVDQSLFDLRRRLEEQHPNQILDFYEAPLVDRWKKADEDDEEDDEAGEDDGAPDSDPAPAWKEPAAMAPINRIYYGPPGTGKTHKLRELFTEYTDVGAEQDRKTWLVGLIKECRWRDVIAAVLAEKGPQSAPAIRDHDLVQAMLAASGATTAQMIKNCLRCHTPPDLDTVQTKHRAEPILFTKTAESVWSLLPEWRQEEERLTEFVTTYLAGPAAATATQRYRTVTFHPSYSYEDFVRGIRPVATEEDGRTEFQLVDGVFKQICDEAHANPSKRYALFIDEINRGNIAKIFGELITLIEPDKRIEFRPDGSIVGGMTVQLPGSGGGEVVESPFGVPANLDIYGTMNTADRSIALLDIALRRRFEFVEMPPITDATVFPSSVDGINRGALLLRINDRLEYLLDRDHRIGHAYLMKARSLADLRRAFANQIIPLLQEYFFDDLDKVARILSGPGGASPFVRKEELRHDALFAGRASSSQITRFRYVLTDQSQWTAGAFLSIYASTAPVADIESEDAVG